MSYQIVFTQVDEITRLPEWAKGKLEIGQLVYRLQDNHVIAKDGGYKLGRSYTKKLGYNWCRGIYDLNIRSLKKSELVSKEFLKSV